jgi:hypothetical protein
LKGVLLARSKSSVHIRYSTCAYDGSQYNFKREISKYRSRRLRANRGKPGKPVSTPALAAHSGTEENPAVVSKSDNAYGFHPPLPQSIHSAFPSFSTALSTRNPSGKQPARRKSAYTTCVAPGFSPA